MRTPRSCSVRTSTRWIAATKSRAAVTLCLYEDGTAPQWHDGAGDCFRRHTTFSERLEAAFATRPSDEPSEVRSYIVARDLCRGLSTAQVKAGEEIISVRVCGELSRMRDRAAAEKYPAEPALSRPGLTEDRKSGHAGQGEARTR